MVAKVKRGDRFEHTRLIIGSPKAGTARPEVCQITQVTKLAVYYTNESGSRFVTSPERLQEVAARWLEPVSAPKG